ncbi:hypothetical protein HJD18_12275 [Thermoleophilia bacterium SCSIO 60948]|nr:hypothetical protein HJD18_12275 [Thermoleophilia bacterium SCSIO 60948]
MLKRILAAVGMTVLIAGLVAAASPATAKKKTPRDSARVSVEFDVVSQQFTGTVKSTKRCKRFRQVTVTEKQGGLPDGGNGTPTTVGTDRTNENGDYKVKLAGLPDVLTTYKVRVKREVRGKRGNKFICKSAVSKPVEYNPLPMQW